MAHQVAQVLVRLLPAGSICVGDGRGIPAMNGRLTNQQVQLKANKALLQGRFCSRREQQVPPLLPSPHTPTTPVLAVHAGQLEGGGEAVLVAHSGQQVQAAALIREASRAVLRAGAAPAGHCGEQLLHPLRTEREHKSGGVGRAGVCRPHGECSRLGSCSHSEQSRHLRAPVRAHAPGR